MLGSGACKRALNDREGYRLFGRNPYWQTRLCSKVLFEGTHQRLAPRLRITRAGSIAGSTSLQILVLYANPVTASFGATLHREVVKTLRSRGHEIDDCDLYAERFDPVLSEQERMQYHDLRLNRTHIDTYADRLLAAEALVLVYPVWNEGFPAILKGFFDRVFIPGVSFTVGSDGALVTNLQKLRKIAAVCTYGATRTINVLLGDPPRRVVKRLVRWMPGHHVRCDYLAYYGMDRSTQEQRAAFQAKVKRTFEAW